MDNVIGWGWDLGDRKNVDLTPPSSYSKHEGDTFICLLVVSGWFGDKAYMDTSLNSFNINRPHAEFLLWKYILFSLLLAV